MSVLTTPPLDWRRAIACTHRWLGMAGGLLFVAWFASGIVMMYARMPELPARELSDRLPPLDLSRATVSPAHVAARLATPVERVRIGMVLGRPVYRLLAGRTSTTVLADTGEALGPLPPESALAVARELVPEHATTIRHDALLTDADQWTMGVRAQMPMYRVAIGDSADSDLYVAQKSGEAVMRTTAPERRWAYAGAVLHWLYFAPLRRQSALWTQSMIWLSIGGCLLCISGLIWGVSVASKSPYSGLMKWHHTAGLIFGVTSFTFVFSGLLSMGPWSWSPGTAPPVAAREHVAGGPLRLTPLSLERLRAGASALGAVKELEVRQFQGELYLSDGTETVSASHPDRGAFEQFPREAMEEAARVALPGVAIEDAKWLHDYDAYYYDRHRTLSLPVLRVRYADPRRTWLYLDPRTGAIARKQERLTRVNRWLYHGLHSLDFPFLYDRRPLWDVIVIALSIGGLVLSATTLLPAWQRLRRHGRRLRRRD